jgi:glucose/arabinose dehydrogenase
VAAAIVPVSVADSTARPASGPQYRGGAFVVMRGSWNRAPAPMADYNILYQPFAKGRPSGPFEVFADGFKGRTWRVFYRS